MPWRLVARYLAPYVGQDGVRHLLALAASVNGTDLEGLDLAALPMPTLIIRGESDAWLDDTVAERLATAIPESQLIRVPGAGRLIPEDAPEDLTRLILDFVKAKKRGNAVQIRGRPRVATLTCAAPAGIPARNSTSAQTESPPHTTVRDDPANHRS